MRNHFIQTKPSRGHAPAPRSQLCVARGEAGLVALLTLMTLIQAAVVISSVLS